MTAGHPAGGDRTRSDALPATTAPRTRIAVTFDGDPRDRRQWSGTPAGVVGGLESLGVDVVAVDCGVPSIVERTWAVPAAGVRLARREGAPLGEHLRRAVRIGRQGRGMARARSATAAARLRGSTRLDGIVQIGTGYRVPVVAPIVTYEDMTVPQAVRHGFAPWGSVAAGQVAYRRSLQQRCYAVARAQAFMSPWAEASAVAEYGLDPGDVHVVGVGCPDPVRRVDRDWTVPRFLFVGLDWERKNGPAVVRAFEAVRATYPTATLDLVGGHPQIDVPGVTGHGVIDRSAPRGDERLRALFDRSTCFVMPSLLEPAGIVYVEAMACGLPVLGTLSGGASSIVGNGGLCVDPRDEAAIAAAMRRLAEPDLARARSGEAVVRAETLTWSAVASRLLGALGVHP